MPTSPLLGNVEVEFDARTLTAAGDAGEGGEAVRIFGEVQKPGTFAFKKSQSAVDMIIRTGGTIRYAGVEKIRVMNGSETFLFNLKEYLDTGSGDLIPETKPGATIFIPIRVDEVKAGSRTVYVMGAVVCRSSQPATPWSSRSCPSTLPATSRFGSSSLPVARSI